MSTAIRVAERHEQVFDAIQWDGTQAAADWIDEHFPGQATFTGDDPELDLMLYGTWPIERGYWIVDRWGGPNPTPPEQLNDQFSLPAPNIEIPELP